MAVKCFRLTAELFYGLCLFTFAFNAIVIPQLIQHKVCHNKFNSSICLNLYKHPSIENEVQASAASWMSVIPLSALLPALFTILMIGPISDLIGKRKTMILPPLIYLIQSLVYIILIRINRPFSPGIFIIPYCLSGIFGDNPGCASLAEAYISSITLAKNRTIRMAILESSIFVGTIAAAFLSGLMLVKFGFLGAFCTTAVVNFINLNYVIFILPSEKSLLPALSATEKRLAHKTDQGSSQEESVSEGDFEDDGSTIGANKESSPSTLQILNPWRCLLRIKEALCMRGKVKQISAIFALFAIALFANMGEIYFGILFIKHSPFEMKSRGIGYLVATQASLRMVGVLTVPYLCQRFLKFKDIHLVMVGFSTQAVYFISWGFTTTVLELFLLQIISFSMAVHQPVFRSMVSKLVDAEHYGSAIAAAEAVDIASSLMTSLISNQIYAETLSIFRGFTVCLLGVLAFFGLLGAIAFSIVFKDDYDKPPEQQQLLAANPSYYDSSDNGK